MADRKLLEQRDEALESRLVSIMKNPELAEQAFPGKEMREKVVPLFQYMRRKVEGIKDK